MSIQDPKILSAVPVAEDPSLALIRMCTYAAGLLDAAEATGNPGLVAVVRPFVEELRSGIAKGLTAGDRVKPGHQSVPSVA